MAQSAAATPSYENLLAENRALKLRLQQLEGSNAQTAATTTSDSTASANATSISTDDPLNGAIPPATAASPWSHQLSTRQIERYSRQLILSELGGADTQARLLRTRVLVIGAGGLGAPVCLYLAAAGIGSLTIVDGDSVELSNLHRQVIHTESRIGQAKAISAAQACRDLNKDVHVLPIVDRFTESNAIALAESCDLIVDASDNVATRYLANDVAIACGKVLVSGSALRMEGQVSVFGLGGGPCYRCLYPQPPPAASVTNCSDGGVLGAITGIIGCIQALEVVKIAAGLVVPLDHDGTMTPQQILSPSSIDFNPVASATNMSTLNSKLLLFDGSSSSFRCVKLRPRNLNCVVCGTNPTITKSTLMAHALDYQIFCGSANHDGPTAATKSSGGSEKVPTASVHQLKEAMQSSASSSASSHSVAASSSPSTAVAIASSSSSSSVLLLDVREPVQYRICALPGAINVPLRVLKQGVPTWLKDILAAHMQQQALLLPAADTSIVSSAAAAPTSSSLPVQSTTAHPASSAALAPSSSSSSASPPSSVFVMCRRGVDSVTATRLLMAEMQKIATATSKSSVEVDNNPTTQTTTTPFVRHVSGGLQAWNERVDTSFPLY